MWSACGMCLVYTWAALDQHLWTRFGSKFRLRAKNRWLTMQKADLKFQHGPRPRSQGCLQFRELPQGDLDRLDCIAYVQANAQKHRDGRGRFVAGLLRAPPPENALIGNVLMEVHAPRKDGKRRKLGESLIRVLKARFAESSCAEHMVLRKCGSQAALEAGVHVKEARAIMGMAAGRNMMNRMAMGRSCVKRGKPKGHRACSMQAVIEAVRPHSHLGGWSCRHKRWPSFS